MGTKLKGPCGQGDVEKVAPPAVGVENLTASGVKLLVQVLLGF